MAQLDFDFLSFPLGNPQLNTRAISGSTAAAGELTGAWLCIMNASGANPGTYTTRSAANMITDSGLTANSRWIVLFVNGQGTGTATLAAGSGVTVNGTTTVAPITARPFMCVVTNYTTPAITMTGLTISFTATALAFGV